MPAHLYTPTSYYLFCPSKTTRASIDHFTRRPRRPFSSPARARSTSAWAPRCVWVLTRRVDCWDSPRRLRDWGNGEGHGRSIDRRVQASAHSKLIKITSAGGGGGARGQGALRQGQRHPRVRPARPRHQRAQGRARLNGACVGECWVYGRIDGSIIGWIDPSGNVLTPSQSPHGRAGREPAGHLRGERGGHREAQGHGGRGRGQLRHGACISLDNS